MREQLMVTALGLLAACGLCYGLMLRAWIGRLRSPEVANLSDPEREAYLASPEYRRLRSAVR